MEVRIQSWGRRAVAGVLDALLPPRCVSCEAPVESQGRLCADCWGKVRFLEEPMCACCGVPFEFAHGAGTLCGACAATAPRFRRARSVFVYDDGSREIVLRFKHADRTDAAPVFGAWLARAGAAMLARAEVVAPVPLHRARLFRRRYNQAALLANAAGRAAGVAVAADLLQRVRNTPVQGGLSRVQRYANVRGAFRVRPGRRAAVDGRVVVLVDDVMTTGATADSCARALLGAGAVHVDVLTLARVVSTGADTI